MSISVIELRNYLIGPGSLEHFIDFYEDILIEKQEAFGMTILAQFRVLDAPERFVFMRGFESMQARFEKENAFYDGPVWEKYKTVPNSMILEYHNVRLLRPLEGIEALTCGRSMRDVAAEVAEGTISARLDVFAIDIIKARPGERDALIERFQSVVMPEFQRGSIQMRGMFVGEMGKNDFKRHPAIQDGDELIVFSAYESEAACKEQRGEVGSLIGEVLGDLLAGEPECLMVAPTIKSAVRYLP